MGPGAKGTWLPSSALQLSTQHHPDPQPVALALRLGAWRTPLLCRWPTGTHHGAATHQPRPPICGRHARWAQEHPYITDHQVGAHSSACFPAYPGQHTFQNKSSARWWPQTSSRRPHRHLCVPKGRAFMRFHAKQVRRQRCLPARWSNSQCGTCSWSSLQPDERSHLS